MPRSRPPKAAGTYGALDMARQPSRLGGLELSAAQVPGAPVSWRPFLGLRRTARVLDISGITLVRSPGELQ